jgi:hypothetical protein
MHISFFLLYAFSLQFFLCALLINAFFLISLLQALLCLFIFLILAGLVGTTIYKLGLRK